MTETSPALREGNQLPLFQESDFAALLEGADFVKGFALTDKAELVGKVFIITHIRFNPGMGGDFVSAEAVTREGSNIVFNDGSTGIRRQLVNYLSQKGLVDPGKGPEEGPECRYDNPFSDWKKGKEEAVNGWDIRLVCARGLRVSEYEWPAGSGQLASTWYLA